MEGNNSIRFLQIQIGIGYSEKDMHLGAYFMLYDYCTMRFKDFF